MKSPILNNLTVYNPLNGIFEGKIITLYDIMQLLDTYNLTKAVTGLQYLEGRYRNDNLAIREYENGRMEKLLREIAEQLQGLKLPRTSESIDEFLSGAFNDRYREYLPNNYNRHFFRKRISDILLDVGRDMKRIYFIQLSSNEQRLYRDQMPFGKQVFDQFAPIREDVEESARCLSLQRYTACGMHCMRVLERVVEMLAKRANVPFFDANNQPMGWHKLVAGVQNKADKIPSRSSHAKILYKEQISLALSHLTSAKHVRNALQHPRHTLFDYEAHGCYQGTGNFLELVARQNLLRKTAIHLK